MANRMDSGEAAVKETDGKPMWDLLPWEVMEEVVWAYQDGLQGREPHDWKKGQAWSFYFAGCMRHLKAWFCGERDDKKSGRHHLAHLVAGALILLYYDKMRVGEDDRPRPRPGQLVDEPLSDKTWEAQ